MNETELIPGLFRAEYRKIVSVLCRYFGSGGIGTAEDIASDTFLTAAQTWGVEGIPANPVAWLYAVAKNKAKNHLQRKRVFENKVSPEIKDVMEGEDEPLIDLSPASINDSQLKMMFAICQPCISREAQVALSLRILCGFGIDEIAAAFLANRETINKRLSRAKQKLREERITIDLPPPADILVRLEAVLTTIYLLFNEGYYAAGNNIPLRKELCFEAIRLCTLLVENPFTNKPSVNALLALMCFHASRFNARIGSNGELVLYDEQDVSRWNSDFISKGGYFLQCAAGGDTLSRYHLEAAIAWWHTRENGTPGKWEHILQLYNQLLQLEYSPIAALNRTYALSKANGKEEAIAEAEKLELTGHALYHSLLGELYAGIDNEKAMAALRTAFQLSASEADRAIISHRMQLLEQKKDDTI